ncbi:cellulase family glycosylhydrolase [Asticcacaulis sp. AC402]|uniref:cellulase family glycosylhydrolase n=1 Tax=Asticcacaulis sp. AC402 TaxID=1282361 RepID=UPI0003C3C9C3|nr:cellulase family glycosylhydrolase [Asticcacaulis sp. AC402]ESQ76695.1 glycosyl hydrolase [Asticcacaulis sp. AC402]
MKRLLATVAALLCLASPALAGDITFWDAPQYGGNSFNGAPPDEAYFRALKATGAAWVRLTWSKWKGERQDFLIGDADVYSGIPASDLATLIKTMDAADAAGVKVVLVPLSLPGDRWNQQNGGKHDERLWNDRAYWDQSAAFWRDLAVAVKGHPALAGYNLLNEPTPEKGQGLAEDADAATRIAWYAKHKGTTRDLPALYEHIIKAIREVDPNTPVMVDGGWYANAGSFAYWTPLKDDQVLYAFHMYEPWNLTSSPQIKRKPQSPYPGPAWPGGETFDRKAMETFLAQPFDWARANGVPANRMVAGEYGCVRVWTDCGAYLNDVLDILNNHGAHWAFYSFREDVWEAMDYEIPPDFPAGRFYYLMGEGKPAAIPRNGPLMTVIREHMK